MPPTTAAFKPELTAQEQKRLKSRIASAKYREKNRKRLASDPAEKERLRQQSVVRVRECRARLDADPVGKERVRLASVEKQRARQAKINADPEARKSFLECKRRLSKKYRDAKNINLMSYLR
jgi:hypothetical protein